MNVKNLKDKKAGIDYILNVILFIFGVVGLGITLRSMAIGEMFTYYTQDSNIFSMCISGIYLFYRKKDIPKWLKGLRYAATVSLMLTFIVVVLVLGPMYGAEWYPWLFFMVPIFFIMYRVRSSHLYHLLFLKGERYW